MDYSLFPYVLDHSSGRIFYVDSRGRVFEWIDDRSRGLGGLSGFWEELINTGIQIGSQAFNASRVSGTQSRQIGEAFEQLAGQTTALFNQIQSKSVVTQADLQAAAQAYSQLAAVVQQYPTPYIQEQWNSPHYRAAYETRLQQIQTAVGQQQTAVGGYPLVSASGQIVAPGSAVSQGLGTGLQATMQSLSNFFGVSPTTLLIGGAVGTYLFFRKP